ncbi:hypothetical protein B7463_g2428, partial [Scytalidium lignicola]
MSDSQAPKIERRIAAQDGYHSAIPVRSVYLQPQKFSSGSVKRPPVNPPGKRWKIERLPSNVSASPPAELDWRLVSEPPWTRIPTEEPLPAELRAAVKDDLIQEWHFQTVQHYCRNLKMPSAESDGFNPPYLLLSCIFKEWFRYHNGEPDIESFRFFANMVRVHSTGITTTQGIVEIHKGLCDKVEPISQVDTKYKMKSTYRAIIIMIDKPVNPFTNQDLATPVDLDKHSKIQTVLLIRTGDDSHLDTPVNFDTLRISDQVLPLGIDDTSFGTDNIVRVSVADAVRFVANLEQSYGATSSQFSQARYRLKEEQYAKAWAEEKLSMADEKGIDNVSATWQSVRRVKAARMGEKFAEWEPYQFCRLWKCI